MLFARLLALVRRTPKQRRGFTKRTSGLSCIRLSGIASFDGPLP